MSGNRQQIDTKSGLASKGFKDSERERGGDANNVAVAKIIP